MNKVIPIVIILAILVIGGYSIYNDFSPEKGIVKIENGAEIFEVKKYGFELKLPEDIKNDYLIEAHEGNENILRYQVNFVDKSSNLDLFVLYAYEKNTTEEFAGLFKVGSNKNYDFFIQIRSLEDSWDIDDFKSSFKITKK